MSRRIATTALRRRSDLRTLAGDVDCQRPRLDLRAQAPAVAYDIAIKLIRIAALETYLDSTSLPHVDMIIAARPPGDQPKKDPYPVREAMR